MSESKHSILIASRDLQQLDNNEINMLNPGSMVDLVLVKKDFDPKSGSDAYEIMSLDGPSVRLSSILERRDEFPHIFTFADRNQCLSRESCIFPLDNRSVQEPMVDTDWLFYSIMIFFLVFLLLVFLAYVLCACKKGKVVKKRQASKLTVDIENPVGSTEKAQPETENALITEVPEVPPQRNPISEYKVNVMDHLKEGV